MCLGAHPPHVYMEAQPPLKNLFTSVVSVSSLFCKSYRPVLPATKTHPNLPKGNKWHVYHWPDNNSDKLFTGEKRHFNFFSVLYGEIYSKQRYHIIILGGLIQISVLSLFLNLSLLPFTFNLATDPGDWTRKWGPSPHILPLNRELSLLYKGPCITPKQVEASLGELRKLDSQQIEVT